jgi:hypothetical protein
MTLNTFVAASGFICPGFYRGMRVSFITTSLFCWVRSLCLLTKLTALSTTVALDSNSNFISYALIAIDNACSLSLCIEVDAQLFH